MNGRLVMLCAASAALLIHGSAVAVSEAGANNTRDLLDRFLRSAEPRLVSYRARRTLEASSKGGRIRGALEAVTTLNEDGTFRFEIVGETGSSLIRERVLLPALRAEQRTYERHEVAMAELTQANYEFMVRDGTIPGTARLELVPRRRSEMLLYGHAIVTTATADLLRVEGTPSRLPSYWTRQVDIVCDYARVGGARVITAIRSRADVRVAGESFFSMTYSYSAVNGKVVK